MSSPLSTWRSLVPVSALALLACGHNQSSGSDGPQSPDLRGVTGATLTEVQTQVFNARCGGLTCHLKGPFSASLNLSAGHAWASLVNVGATQAPGKLRVKPGDVAGSFLWQKLNNQIPPDGSEGKPMPQGEAIMWSKLPDNLLSLVQSWIGAGALND